MSVAKTRSCLPGSLPVWGLCLLLTACMASGTGTPSAPVTQGKALSATALSVQGHVLMPSGIKQTANGIMMPSGLLLHSGILFPSGFRMLSAENPAYDKIFFKVEALDLLTGKKIAETMSDGKGNYRFPELPLNLQIRIMATALADSRLQMEAMAHLPNHSMSKATRNLSPQTTAATLLADELSHKPQTSKIPLLNMQKSHDFDHLLNKITTELVEKELDDKSLTEILDQIDHDPSILAEAISDLEHDPALLNEIEDTLADEDLTGGVF